MRIKPLTLSAHVIAKKLETMKRIPMILAASGAAFSLKEISVRESFIEERNNLT
jgi:hypothetical protein